MTTTNVQDINAAIAQAREAASAAVGQQSTGVAVHQPANTNVSTAVVAGRPIKLGELIASAGLQVKAFLKVDKPGFLVGKDTTTYFEELPVEFRLNSIKPFYGCRFGDPAKYIKSFDRLTESKTKRPWADMVAEAQRLDIKCSGDYPSADIPLTVLIDLAPKKGGELLCAAGEALGLTLSITNFTGFAQFIGPYENARDGGGLADDALLRGKLVHTQRTKGSNTWGIVEFRDFLIVNEAAGEAAAA